MSATAVRMDDPATWPHLVLPVVRRRDCAMPECGVLVPGRGATVHLVALHEATLERLSCCYVETHATFEKLRRAGWEVD